MDILDQAVELLDGHPYLRGLANGRKSNKSYPSEHPTSLWFTHYIWLIEGMARLGKGPDWVVPAANSKRKVQSILIYRLPGLCLLSSSSLISCLTHSTNATSLGLRLHHPGSVCKFCDSLLLQLPLDPSCLHQVSLWFFQKVRVQFLRQHAVGYMSSNICQSSVTRCAMRAALFYVSGVKTTWNLWISSLWINESS